MEKGITLKSYAKINLSLDVLGVLPNGYHAVEMVMQQISLYDEVSIGRRESGESKIILTTNREDLSVKEDNISYKAALLMMETFKKTEIVTIHIEKHIPIAAGLAGGSGNGAAIILALNHLWELNQTVKQLCDIGVTLGADVPFCIMGQAKANKGLNLCEDPMAAVCALAEGIGEKLTPLPPLQAFAVLSKPPLGVSTEEVYRGIDEELELEAAKTGDPLPIKHNIDTHMLIQALKNKNQSQIAANLSNILELFTLKRYPIIMYTKNMMERQQGAAKVLMSGSGPTVFAIYWNKVEAEECYKVLRSVNDETYLAETLV